jgi:hypothetical protein
MHEKGVEELFGMISDLARRQPAAFIGGAALLGFIASRFARSSARHVHAGDGGMAHPLSGAPSISEPWPISPTPTGRGATGIGGRGGAVSPLQPSEGGL